MAGRVAAEAAVADQQGVEVQGAPLGRAGRGATSPLNGPAIVTFYQNLASADRMAAAMATLGIAGIGTTPVSVAAPV